MERDNMNRGIEELTKWVAHMRATNTVQDVGPLTSGGLGYDFAMTFTEAAVGRNRAELEQFMASLTFEKHPDISAIVGVYMQMVAVLANAMATMAVGPLMQENDLHALKDRIPHLLTGIKWAHDKGFNVGMEVLHSVMEKIKQELEARRQS